MLDEVPTRRCNGCKSTKDLTREFFYADFSDPSGFAYRCKECFKQHRRDPKIMATMNAQRLARYHANAEVKRRAHARHAINNAIRDGRIDRPSYCQLCLTGCNPPESHHYLGYEREHWFDVVWLCKRCHIDLDHPLIPAETLPCLAIENRL